MPFIRPSLTQVVDRIKKDLEDKLTGGSPALRRSVIAVISRVFGAASHILHGHLDWISRQILPDTSDEDILLRQGSMYGVVRIPAVYAERDVEFTGANGSTIPAGTELQRSDGVIYTTDALATISGGIATVHITAQDAGDEGNVDTAVILQLVSPLVGIDNEAEVQSTNAVEGEDQEDIEAYRLRVLFRIQNTPQGGAAADYIRWALEVPQVTRAFVFPVHLGPGTVGLSFVLDNEDPIIPDAPKVAEVQAYIDARRPVTVDFLAFAPVASPVNFTIDLLVNDTAEIRAAVEAELRDLLVREAEPGSPILLTHIHEAISIAAGEYDHTLAVPAANLPGITNTIYTFGMITWT